MVFCTKKKKDENWFTQDKFFDFDNKAAKKSDKVEIYFYSNNKNLKIDREDLPILIFEINAELQAKNQFFEILIVAFLIFWISKFEKL